jgi:hypothetical protein
VAYRKKLAGSAVILCAAAAPVLGASQTITWNGGSGAWSTPAAWNLGVVPNNDAHTSYDVLIDGGKAGSSSVQIGPAFSTDIFYTVDSLSIDTADSLSCTAENYAAAQLKVNNSFTVNGSLDLNSAFLLMGTDSSINGTGTIQFGRTGSFDSSVESLGGTLSIGAGVTLRTNSAQSYVAARIGNKTHPLVFGAKLVVDGSGKNVTLAGSSITGTGSIQIGAGATVSIDTTFHDFSELGAITNNGRINVAGTLDNTGRTLTIGGALGRVNFPGLIKGGTLTSSNGQHVVVDSLRMDGVTLNCPVDAVGVVIPYTQTLTGNSVITLHDASLPIFEGKGSLTLDPRITVRGYGLIRTAGALTNRGSLVATDAQQVLEVQAPGGFVNQGTVTIQPGASFRLGGTYRLADLGTINNNGGNLILGGTLDNSGQTFTNGAGYTFNTFTGTIAGGTLSSVPGKELVVPSTYTAALKGVALEGMIRVEGTLVIQNPLSGHGTIQGGGAVLPDQLTGSGDGLIIGPDIKIVGAATVGYPGQPMVNYGSITMGSGKIRGKISNLGTIAVTPGGTVSFGDSFSRADLGTLVNQGGTFQIVGTLDNTGETFTVGDAAGPWTISNGTIRGGTLATTSGAQLVVVNSTTATFDGVIVNGTVAMPSYCGLKLAAGQALSGQGQIILGYGDTTNVSAVSGVTTIGQGMTVRGGAMNMPGQAPSIGASGAALVNEGTIALDPQKSILLKGSSITNRGTLALTDAADMVASGSVIFDGGGKLIVPLGDDATHGVLAITGALDLSSRDDEVSFSFSGTSKLVSQVFLTYTGALTGTFDHVAPGYTVDYSTPGQLRVAAVPEPGTALLAAGACAGAGGRRRRRRRV